MCSSSSAHLQSPFVVLVFQIGGSLVKSTQFTLLSREWKRKNHSPIAGMTVDDMPRRVHMGFNAPPALVPPKYLTTQLPIVVKVVAVSARISFACAKSLLSDFDQHWGTGEIMRRDKVMQPACSEAALHAASTGVVGEAVDKLFWFGVFVSMHTSVESVSHFNKIAYRYISNKIRNPLDLNLISLGLVCCLASFSNL
eukprot:TRINITY_DN3457_c0_g1_i2.p1 TRINITY_DN3457_c0_g1~~TRINITY_DN3457_c0_g1_i2.p1  ORF type:complete len:197 (+),score=44.27 TRINITY_DN3457_c0_g1_i2:546-1136(+)